MEDLAYAVQKGEERTYLFVADSEQRDKSVHPTPSEYAVTFNAPFRNVVKFEILRAMIPRSDYTLDTSTNTLTYSLAVPTSMSAWDAETSRSLRVATFTPGDYNLPQLIDHMNDVFGEVAAAHGDFGQLTVVPTTTPSEVSNKLRIESSVPFCVLADKSTARNLLGFGVPVSADDQGYATVPGFTKNYPSGASSVFVSVPGETSTGSTSGALLGPIPANLGAYEGVYGTRKIQEFFTATTSGTPTTALAYMAVLGTPPGGQWTVNVSIKKRSDDSTIASGSIVATGDDYLPAVSGTLTAAGQFVAGTEYYIEITAADAGTDASNCAAVWFSTTNLPENGSFAAVDGVEVHSGQDFCVDVTVGGTGFSVTPPGIVNLIGARYLTIHCPELEQHIDRDRVGEPSSAGLGMVTLAGYGFRDEQYNFVNYPPKRFNPITLQKLTFRLMTTVNGEKTQYRSLGVNNALLCALTFIHRPLVDDDVMKRAHPLSPGYTPDAVEQQRRRWKIEEDALRNLRKFGR